MYNEKKGSPEFGTPLFFHRTVCKCHTRTPANRAETHPYFAKGRKKTTFAVNKSGILPCILPIPI